MSVIRPVTRPEMSVTRPGTAVDEMGWEKMEFLNAFWKAFAKRMSGRSRDVGDPTLAEAAFTRHREDRMPEVIKEPPMEIDGRVLSADEFVHYVESLDFPHPRSNRIFLHHTWRPTRAEWRGRDSIMAMKAFYEQRLWKDSEGQLHEGWTAGPHLFIADDGIWLFSDLRYDGVGVYGQNYRSRHIEMVGNYDAQLPSGQLLENTVAALGVLHERLGLDINHLNFHRDFSTKSCPGWAVEKAWIIPQVAEWIQNYRRAGEEDLSVLRRSLRRIIHDLLVSTNPQASLARAGEERGLLGALTDEIPMEIDDKGYVVQFFAEALIVPVDEWDKVASLHEYELDQESEGGVRAPGGVEGRDRTTAPPKDPFAFEGRGIPT